MDVKRSTHEATTFNEPHLPDALRRALIHAGPKGFIVSLPQLFAARVKASFSNEIWNNWYTTSSEEFVMKNKEGKPIVLFVHGGGVLTSSPERVEQCYNGYGRGMTSDEGSYRGAAILTHREAEDLLQGRLPNGEGFPVYSYDAFRKGIPNLPMRYGITLDFNVAKNSRSGYSTFEELAIDPVFVCRAGGEDAAKAYLAKQKSRSNTNKMGQWNPFSRVNTATPQGRITFMSGNLGGVGSDGNNCEKGYDADYGIGGDANIHNRGRFIAVCPRHSGQGVGSLNFDNSAKLESNEKLGIKMEPESVYGSSLGAALRQAQWRCVSSFGNCKSMKSSPAGFIASLPNLLHARSQAGFDNEVWKNRYSTYTDQSIVTTPEGKTVVVTVHGGGIFATPERIEASFRMDMQSMTGGYAAKLSKEEGHDLLKGKMPDGSTIPMYNYDQFVTMKTLPPRYGVIMDYEVAKKSPRGYVKTDQLRTDPNFIALAGGADQAKRYLDKISQKKSTVGNWPSFNRVDVRQPQSRVIFLDSDGGILQCNGMVNMGRYVAVVPRNSGESVRLCSFL